MKLLPSGSPAIHKLLDWNDRDKCLLLAVLLWFYMVFLMIWQLVTTHLTAFGERYVSPEGAVQMAEVMTFNLAGWALLVVWGAWLRRAGRDPGAYVIAFLSFFGVSFLLLGLMIGLYSPMTGMVLVGSPLVGFILFGFRRVAWSFAICTLVVLLMAWLSVHGNSYALYFQEDPVSKEALSYYWIASTIAFTVPFITAVITLVALLLRRWTYREAQIRDMAIHDPLTGLANRRELFERFATELARGRRTGNPLAVCVMDLDHFKQINDRHGHAAGDQVLVRVAQLLRESLRETDVLGRIGGEEFVLVLPDTDAAGAATVIERCREQIHRSPVRFDQGESLTVSASFGITVCQAGAALSETQLITRADEALYRAKASGRNRVEVWSSAEPLSATV
ncbi:MAG: diguanylate cyclase [Pseudomonadales bacterium]|nr:diguanylate cyclase [Pseudomonadales bacterium]